MRIRYAGFWITISFEKHTATIHGNSGPKEVKLTMQEVCELSDGACNDDMMSDILLRAY